MKAAVKHLLGKAGGFGMLGVFKGAGKKFASTPQQMLEKTVNRAIARRGLKGTKAIKSFLKDNASVYGKGYSVKKGQITKFPEIGNLSEGIQSRMTARASISRMRAGQMVNQ